MAEAEDHFDLVIIGGGPGGYSAAIRARQLGLRIALVEEKDTLGGTCLNWGCIPTKTLLKQAEIFRLLHRADEFGFRLGKVEYDWQKVIARSRSVVEELAPGIDYLMRKNDVLVIPGRGRLSPTREVEISDVEGRISRTVTGDDILISTGSRPRSLPGVDIDGELVISSEQAMALEQQPGSLVVIGGGAIGLEFAYFFNAFGTRVKVLERLPQILPREDAESVAVLARNLAEQGIQFEVGVEVTAVDRGYSQAEVHFKSAAGDEVACADQVLMAIGVTGNVEDLGLAALGVRTSSGAIGVDGRLRTSVPGIYAVGDVIGPPQLAHMASAEGAAAVEFIAGQDRAEIDRSLIPSCTYCQPQLASVGLNEEVARVSGHDVRVGRFSFSANGKARAVGEAAGLVKLVFDSRFGEVLGGTIVGSEATELIAEVALACKLEATYEEFIETVHAHPTLSEGVMEAAAEAFGVAMNL